MSGAPRGGGTAGGGVGVGDGRSVVFATRIHLGHAKTPPSADALRRTVGGFLTWASQCGASRAGIAVDPAPKIGGYDLVRAVGEAVEAHRTSARTGGGGDEASGGSEGVVECDVVPVTPWGKFVPALNALVSWAAGLRADLLMLASAETTLPASSVERLVGHVGTDTLVAGCALPGHDYRGEEGKEGGQEGVRVELTGRTVPWNTCAVWSVPKLALTGFPLVAEGLHPLPDGEAGPSGVEEVATVSVLHRVLPQGMGVAKLVNVPGVSWDVEWDDEERRAWHERKMASKVSRAARHAELLGLEGGYVLHC